MKTIEQGKGRSITQTRAEAIDRVLSFLFLTEEKSDWSWLEKEIDQRAARGVIAFNRLPLTHFDGADICRMYDSLIEGTTSYQRLYYTGEMDENNQLSNTAKQDLLSLPNSWDFCFGGFFPEVPTLYPEAKGGYLFSLCRYRTVPLKEVRGLFRLRASFVVEESEAHLFNDGSYLSGREYLQYFSGAWHCVGVPFEVIHPEPLEPVGQTAVWMARSGALTKEYDWSVHIGFNVKSVPTVSIPSDPISARDVFKLREVPAGKNRRAALKHWVSAHTRKSSLDPNYAETYIWPYLRGAEEFTWQGLYCKIQPSEYDLKKAAEYQAIRGIKHGRMVVQ